MYKNFKKYTVGIKKGKEKPHTAVLDQGCAALKTQGFCEVPRKVLSSHGATGDEHPEEHRSGVLLLLINQ